MVFSLASFICTCSLSLLYVNILALLFMSRSIISSTTASSADSSSISSSSSLWGMPSFTPTLLTQYYELRNRLFHSANYSIEQNRIVIVHQFTLTYSEFVFVMLVVFLCGVYALVSVAHFILTLYWEIGYIRARKYTDCAICMESMRRFIRVSQLPCKHVFCKTCLELWVNKFNYDSCPICRQPVSTSNNNSQLRIEIIQTIFHIVLQELSDDDEIGEFVY